jgi:hypothetical protein
MDQSIEYDWEYIEINQLNLDISITDNNILQEEQQKRQEEKELIEKSELELIEDLFTNNNKRMKVKLPVNNEEKEEVIIKSRKQTLKKKINKQKTT